MATSSSGSPTGTVAVPIRSQPIPSPIHFGYGVAYRASPGAKASRVRLFTRRALRQYPRVGCVYRMHGPPPVCKWIRVGLKQVCSNVSGP